MVYRGRKLATASAVALLFTIMTACGGRGSATLPPSPAPTAGAPASAQRATATVTITVPKPSSSTRKPAYVSPATQSVAISFTPSGGGAAQTFNQNLTAGSPGCTASLVSPLICTIALSILPGTYTASFTTYDGVLNGSGVPQGNILSQNQNFSTTIVAAQANTINATLQGVASSVTITALGGTATQTASNTFTIDKCFATQQFSVLGLDADGNVIVGPGAPAVSLTTSSALYTIAPPTTANPNTFTLTRTGLPVGGTSANAGATLTPGTGGPAASTTMLGLTFNTSNCGVGTTIGSGWSVPEDAVADTSGNVYVADTGNNRIVKVDPSGGLSLVAGLFSSPYALAVNAAGTIFVADTGSGSIKQITSGGTVSNLRTGLSTPCSIALSPNGNLYFVDQAAQIVDLVNLGAGPSIPIGSGWVLPSGVAVGANGTVYVADQNTGINAVASDETQSSIAPGNPNIMQPFGIAVDAAGDVYFSDLLLGAVFKITPNWTVSTFASGLNQPGNISIAANGDIYVTEANANTVHRYR
jgi:sugar lactone lactonase YvrE